MSATWSQVLRGMILRGTATEVTLDGALRWGSVTRDEHADLLAYLRQVATPAPGPRAR